jgi:hypothetical protein
MEPTEDFEGEHYIGYMEGRRDPALSVPCPKRGCGAKTGGRCWNWNHQRTRDVAHKERRISAALGKEPPK